MSQHLFTLSTRNASGIAANFAAADRRAQRRIRTAVRRAGIRTHELAYNATPVRTRFMQSQLRLRFSEGGLVYEVGWDEADFEAAGLVFYPIYVLFGTRTQAPNDPLFPAHAQVRPQLTRDVGEELRAAFRRRVS